MLFFFLYNHGCPSQLMRTSTNLTGPEINNRVNFQWPWGDLNRWPLGFFNNILSYYLVEKWIFFLFFFSFSHFIFFFFWKFLFPFSFLYHKLAREKSTITQQIFLHKFYIFPRNPAFLCLSSPLKHVFNVKDPFHTTFFRKRLFLFKKWSLAIGLLWKWSRWGWSVGMVGHTLIGVQSQLWVERRALASNYCTWKKKFLYVIKKIKYN